MKFNSQSTQCWRMKLKKKISIKKRQKKKLESTELTHQTHDTGYETKLTTYIANHYKSWILISNQLNVEV
jgi:hypothetical protein